VNIPSSVTSVGWKAFDGSQYWYDYNPFSPIVYLDGWMLGIRDYPGSILTLLSDTRGVSDRAFYDESGFYTITGVGFPESFLHIGAGAFQNSEHLANVGLPSTLLTIGNAAFYNCDALLGATLPAGLESIGWSAFENCVSLLDVSIPASVTSVGGDAFLNTAFWNNYSTGLDSLVSQDGWACGSTSTTPAQAGARGGFALL